MVVADGCTDRTQEVVRLFEHHLQIRLIEQDNQGAATARNRGASEAYGELLIFIDDDIEVFPRFLEAHQNAHQGNPNRVAIGYLPPLLMTQKGYLKAELRYWWESMFQKMCEREHRFRYTDLVSGNFSLSKRLFLQTGGFDPAYHCHEDYELGFRLLRIGAEFYFIPQSKGYHHEESDIERVLQRKYEEGISDVMLGQQYPGLRPTLLMSRLQEFSLLPSRVLKLLAFTWRGFGDRFARFFQSWLAFCEKIRWYTMWHRLLYGLMGYWYWRGVSERLSHLREIKDFLSESTQTSQPEMTLKIDLGEGITNAEAILETYHPDEVKIYLKQSLVGFVREQPGAEKLRDVHLRSILARDFPLSLLNALAKDPDFAHPEAAERLSVLCTKFLKKHKMREASYSGDFI